MATQKNKTRTREELDNLEFNYFHFFQINPTETDAAVIRKKINTICNSKANSAKPNDKHICMDLKDEAIDIMLDSQKRKEEADRYRKLTGKPIAEALETLSLRGVIYKKEILQIAKKYKQTIPEMMGYLKPYIDKGVQYIDDEITNFDLANYEAVDKQCRPLNKKGVNDLYEFLGLPKSTVLDEIKSRIAERKKEDADRIKEGTAEGKTLNALYKLAETIFAQEGDGDKPGRLQYLSFLALKEVAYLPLKEKAEAGFSNVYQSDYEALLESVSEKLKIPNEKAKKDLNGLIKALNLNIAVSSSDIKDWAKDDETYARYGNAYKEALALFGKGKYQAAKKGFEAIRGHFDSEEWIKRCDNAIEESTKKRLEDQYLEAKKLFMKEDYAESLKIFRRLGSYLDAKEWVARCESEIEGNKEKLMAADFQSAITLYNAGKYDEALDGFRKIGDYPGTSYWIKKCQEEIEKEKRIRELSEHTNGVLLFGEGKYEEALKVFQGINGYADAGEWIVKCQEKIGQEKEHKTRLSKYQKAMDLYDKARYEEALKGFKEIEGYLDSTTLIKKCEEGLERIAIRKNMAEYQKGFERFDDGDYDGAIAIFRGIENYSDSKIWIKKSQDYKAHYADYQSAVSKYEQGGYQEALALFEGMKGFTDADSWASKCRNEISKKQIENRENTVTTKIIDTYTNNKRWIARIVFSLPLLLAIIFGIILFTNKEQVQMVSSYTGWIIGWLVVLVFGLASFPLTFNNEASFRMTLACGVGTLVVAIIGFSSASQLEPNFYPPSFVSIEALNRQNRMEDSTYHSNITFRLTNSSSIEVTHLTGEMVFYNKTAKTATFSSVNFSGTFTKGQEVTYTIDFYGTNLASFYSTDFSAMGITYQISRMSFTSYSTRSYDADPFYIKRPS